MMDSTANQAGPSSATPGTTDSAAEVHRSERQRRAKKPEDAPYAVYDVATRIQNDIPEEGISHVDLSKKFESSLINKNARLFIELIAAVSTVETDGLLHRNKDPPRKEEIDKITEGILIRYIPPVVPEDRKMVVNSVNVAPMTVTFTETSELIRKRSGAPSAFWRAHWEYAKTLSRYVEEHTAAKHCDRPHLKLKPGAAFQSIGEFDFLSDLTRERVDRHLVWLKAYPPSSYVSTFDNFEHAMKRVEFFSHISKRVAERVFMVKIDTTNLTPATIKCRVRQTVTLLATPTLAAESTFEDREVSIPIWIRTDNLPSGSSTMTIEQLQESNAEVWVSVHELRYSNLKADPTRRGHPDEWLACGHISEKYIKRVMPYDGETLHTREVPGEIVKSAKNTERWIWCWEKQWWNLEKNEQTNEHSQQQTEVRASAGPTVRKRVHLDEPEKASKRPRNSDDDFNDESSEHESDSFPHCPTCTCPST